MASKIVSKLVKPPVSLYGADKRYVSVLCSATTKYNKLEALEDYSRGLANLYSAGPRHGPTPQWQQCRHFSSTRLLQFQLSSHRLAEQTVAAPQSVQSQAHIEKVGETVSKDDVKYVEEVDDMIVMQSEPVKELTKTELVWTSLDNTAQVAAIKGAVIPFSQLNFIQTLFFPYTYLAMFYLDLMLHFLPWWQAIIATTATARIAFFPFVLKQNIIGIKSANILPETQKLQVKINEAMISGDAYNLALLRTKLQLLYKEHGLSMKDRLLPILIQAPMYASIFFLLRTLTGVPVDGLSTGGALWFTDLTVPDPYYILPLMTSTSMLMLFEFGMEGAVNPQQQMAPIGRYLLRAMPFGLFYIIQGFPAATLLFWSTSNLFTLIYALVMKNQWVKQKFNIPARIQHDLADLPLSTQTFKGQVKSAMDRGKVKRTSMDVRRLDDIAFKKAGVGPLKKTYKEPPKTHSTN